MNNVDEIVKRSTKNNFDKNEWAKRKQQERNDAYALIDSTALEIINNPKKFKEYIDIQSKFDKYSVGNALLITAQMPTATKMKDFNSWKESGGFVNKNAKGITILEPGDSYEKSDGTTSQTFNPKKLFDISQTNVKETIKENSYDEKLLLQALLYECPVNVKVEDKLENEKIADWDKESETLYVGRDSDTTAIFNAISNELAKSNFDSSETKELVEFKSNCIVYMISNKYNLDNANIEINQLPESFKQLTAKDIRNELSSMRSVFEDMNGRMSQYFESISKSNKNKDYER